MSNAGQYIKDARRSSTRWKSPPNPESLLRSEIIRCFYCSRLKMMSHPELEVLAYRISFSTRNTLAQNTSDKLNHKNENITNKNLPSALLQNDRFLFVCQMEPQPYLTGITPLAPPLSSLQLRSGGLQYLISSLVGWNPCSVSTYIIAINIGICKQCTLSSIRNRIEVIPILIYLMPASYHCTA